MTRTRPGGIERPIDTPVASTQSGADDAARLSAEAMSSGCVIDLAGLPTSVIASSSTALAVARLFRDAQDTERAPIVSIITQDEGPETPSRTPDEQPPGLELWYTDDVVHLRHTGGLSAIVEDDTLRAGGTDDVDRGIPALLQEGIGHLFARHDRFVMHAGAIARDDRAYLVLGVTGAGKSTLCAAARSGGWDILSDDLVAIRRSDHQPKVAGLPKPPRFSVGDASDRVRIEGEPGRSGWFRVAGSILVGHDRGPGSLEPLDDASVLATLIGAFPARATALDAFMHAAGEIAYQPAWTLLHTEDEGERTATALRHLDTLTA